MSMTALVTKAAASIPLSSSFLLIDVCSEPAIKLNHHERIQRTFILQDENLLKFVLLAYVKIFLSFQAKHLDGWGWATPS